MARVSWEIFVMPSVMYSLEIYRRQGLSDKDVTAILNALWYQKGKFPEVSFFMGVSNTNSATAKRKVVHTGKRGRPRIVIEGKQEPQHVHIGAVGKGAYSFMHKMKKSVDRRFYAEVGSKTSRVVSKKKLFHAIDFLTYAYRQSQPFYTGGDFDFEQYTKDPFFLLKSWD